MISLSSDTIKSLPRVDHMNWYLSTDQAVLEIWKLNKNLYGFLDTLYTVSKYLSSARPIEISSCLYFDQS